MSADLFQLAENAIDEASFIEFLSALAQDREDENAKEAIAPSSPYGAGANGWENGTIEAFLGAAAAWAQGSIDGLPLYQKPSNPWRRCADILLMGKLYE
ncbi:MAG: hypothetical protein EOP88_20350 [Verrucomicrobiaceae bacterium]|nr:MAG: hypothetical protein EOP88_20350 [Verrucomicrobiaceae bacterium]